MAAAFVAILPQIIDLVEAAVTQIPALETEFERLFASGAPTASDFAALRAKVASENFAVIPTTATTTTTSP